MKKIMDWKTASAALVVVASSISLAACGGGSSDGGGGSAGGEAAPALDADQQALADALATQLAASPVALTDAQQSQCTADKMVAGIGVDRLAELGVTTENPAGINSLGTLGMTDSEATTATDALFSCTDVKEAMKKNLASTMGGDEVANCIVDKIDENDLKEFMKSLYLGQTPSTEMVQKLGESSAGCVTG